MAAIEKVAEEVAQNIEEVAEVTRHINHAAVMSFLGGTGFGSVLGLIFGIKFGKERAKDEAFKKSEEEVELLRRTYEAKILASEEKPSVEEIIREKGYSVEDLQTDTGRVLRPPVPMPLEPVPSYDIPEPGAEPPSLPDTEAAVPPVVNSTWNYALEMSRRSLEAPYVIHQNEFMESENGYEQVTYSYYVDAGVLVTEDDQPMPHWQQVVGAGNLKWGHGSDDENVVYIRNDKRRLDIELCRVRGEYGAVLLEPDSDDAA